jgi:hypothetical protein
MCMCQYVSLLHVKVSERVHVCVCVCEAQIKCDCCCGGKMLARILVRRSADCVLHVLHVLHVRTK